MAMVPGVTFRTIDEPQPGAKLAAVYGQRAQAYAAWYLQHGDDARPSAAEGLEALAPAHARAGARLRGHGARGGRRRSRGRPHVHDVEAARRRDRLLAGRAARRRARSAARAELRLSGRAHGCRHPAHRLPRAHRDRGDRRRLGSVRRHERPGPGRLAHVRRPSVDGRGVRRADRDPLPARDVRHGRGGARRARAPAERPHPQPDARRRVGRRAHRLPQPRPAARRSGGCRSP